ncbi:insulinase family protein [Candidatus Woesebacteria bacterium]|nr:insulinase family protein [Candidatus Woesebacteria bacterium]
MKTVQKILPNNLKCIFVDTNEFPTATVLLVVKTGSRNERKQINGIAHFIEHMLFKGSKRFPSSFVINATIDGLGGIVNAFTAKDHTGFWVKAPVEHIETILTILADMIQRPLLPEDQIEREKKVIIEEINSYEDSPSDKISDIFSETIYPDDPLGWDIAGTKTSVSSLEKKDIIAFMRRHYRPGNAVLVVAGGLSANGFSINTITKKVQNTFLSWSGKVSSQKFHAKQSTTNKLHVHHKKTEQAHFAFGFPTFKLIDERRYALTVLTTILGAGMSSRLFMKLREELGLCYYVYTSKHYYEDSGYMVSYAGVTNSHEHVAQALKSMWDEHDSFVKGQITNEEIKRAKEILKGRTLIALENSMHVASMYAMKYLFEQTLANPKEIIEKIEQVTKDEIISVAHDIIAPQRLHIGIIGPFDKSQFDITTIFDHN